MIVATRPHIHHWLIADDNRTGACACGEIREFDNRSAHGPAASASREKGTEAKRERGTGVFLKASTGKWVAYRTVDGKKQYFGQHDTEEAALEARRVAMENRE